MTSLYFLLLIGIPLLVGLWAQAKISGTYKKYSQIGSRSRLTGREAAAYVMRNAGIRDVSIVAVRGHLTDHYDPANRRLALSQENFALCTAKQKRWRSYITNIGPQFSLACLVDYFRFGFGQR